MVDETQARSAAMLDETDIRDLTTRNTDALNEVILQADYTKRAALSFYRFRQLGGDYHLPRRKTEPGTAEKSGVKKNARKLALGESTGRGVHYVSSHPKVPILNLSIIALMIIFESAANAYFFAKQSEFGLAGGIFQAAAVSLANVATAFFVIGYWGMRHISMPVDRERFFSRRNLIIFLGLVAIFVGLTLVLLVNLSAAHYRNILDIAATGKPFPDGISATIFPRFLADPDVCNAVLNSELGNTIGSAATNAMCRPLALHSLDAMVLFALGLAIAAVAAFEGRRLDSPFPGFSDAARSLESARADLQEALYDFDESYNDIKAIILEVKYGPADPDDPEDVYNLERKDGMDLTPKEKLLIRKTMDEMTAPYIELLRSTDSTLSDEFGLELEIIDEIGRTPRSQG